MILSEQHTNRIRVLVTELQHDLQLSELAETARLLQIEVNRLIATCNPTGHKRRNGNGHARRYDLDNQAYMTAAYWRDYRAQGRKTAAYWARNYPNLDSWTAAHPGEPAGWEVTGLEYRLVYPPSIGEQKPYYRDKREWEEEPEEAAISPKIDRRVISRCIFPDGRAVLALHDDGNLVVGLTCHPRDIQRWCARKVSPADHKRLARHLALLPEEPDEPADNVSASNGNGKPSWRDAGWTE